MGRSFPGVVVLVAFAQAAWGAELRVVAVSPAALATAPTTTPIRIAFDRPVDPSTINGSTLRVFGRSSGTATGRHTFASGNRIVTLTPGHPFFHGEVVLVNLSRSVSAADGSPLRTAGHAYQFMTGVKPASRVFDLIDVMTVEDGGPTPRIYGALAADFDGDRWIDLGAVNEETSDLRVFLNRADGSGLFDDFLSPPSPLGSTPSPNESADFDNDGRIDACTANIGGTSASIVLGDGDGTFGPQQLVAVGAAPSGIAVLDVDGDADPDLATSNSGGNNVSIARNDGAGVFGASTAIEGGGSQEYALCAGDMNNDGIYDLVVGNRGSQTVSVHRGNGDGTFAAPATRSAGGLVWMISCGDVNGDGNLDVSTANSHSNSGSILLGRGDGTLRAADVTPMTAHVPATDLGDLDGDGDLDWVLSSFGAGHWRLFVNDGDGNFVFDQQFDAPANPSCAIPLDFDNDGDLDLTLTDEISNDLLLQRNAAIAGDADGDGQADAGDCAPDDGQVWQLPGEATGLRLSQSSGLTILSFRAPAVAGGHAPAYDVIRAEQAAGFAGGSAACLESNDSADTLAVDPDLPQAIYYYLARAGNACGEGSAGRARSCP